MSASGFMALINSLVGNEKQAGIVGWLVIMGMSALGGSMFPYDNMPAAMQAIAPWTINHWAIQGFTELVFEEGTVAAVSTHLAVLFGVGAAANVLARFLLVRRFRGVAA
jgi:ABC-2 type transport system permease protein